MRLVTVCFLLCVVLHRAWNCVYLQEAAGVTTTLMTSFVTCRYCWLLSQTWYPHQ